MYRLLLMLFFVPLFTCADSAVFTSTHLHALEKAAARLGPAIRSHSVMIGRLGLAEVRPGFLLGEKGQVLCPYLSPIDDTPAPYLAMLHDGSRVAAEIIFEDEQLNVTLLQLPVGAWVGLVPVSIAPETPSPADQTWFFMLNYGPSPQQGEPATLQRVHRVRSEDDHPHRFTLRSPFRAQGHALFDLAGRLTGLCNAFDGNTGLAAAISLKELADTWPEVAELLPEPHEALLPSFPELPPFVAPGEEDPRLADPLHQAFHDLLVPAEDDPTVVIINDGKSAWHAIQGVIISTNGLVLSKASSLGPSLTCQHHGRDYEAVLLATDEATDLALLAITPDKGLPPIAWSESEPWPGMTLHSPITLPASPGGPFEGDAVAIGNFSHALNNLHASHRSLHAPEAITSLGIVPEQRFSDLRIAALFPEGAAAKGGLRRGDVIRALDEHPVRTRAQLADVLAKYRVGDEVILRYDRKGKERAVTISLGPARLAPPPSGELPPAILTIPSIRRSGFAHCLVHNVPIESWQCGGPVYNCDGSAVGLNIARAAFGRTLALPPKLVKEAIARMTQQSNAF